MRRSSSILKVFLLLLTMLLGSLSLEAQSRASLRGTVSDPQGAVVPGATVTLVNKGTNETRTAVTDDNGLYTFNNLPPAAYRLTVDRSGFKQKALENVSIIPEQLNSLNVQMALGEQKETVTVTDSTQALDTETATVSNTVSSNQIQHLPSFNRDIFQLAQLTPGVFGTSSQNGGGGGATNPGNQGPGAPSGGGGIFATENGPQIQNAGGQYQNNGIQIDGISTVSAVWGGTSIITPSEDAVQSMKVVSNNYDAEFGRFSGAQIQVTSKSGTNNFHGSAFFKASRPGLNAYQRWNGYSSTQCPTDGSPCDAQHRGLLRDENRFNQYGGSIGGPIWKDKIFFFFAWETSPSSTTDIANGWYETDQLRALAPGGSIASQYIGFPGSKVASIALLPSKCSDLGLAGTPYCAEVNGGLDLGSPLTSGLGHQDLTYGGKAILPGVGNGLDGIPDLAQFSTANPSDTSQMQYSGRIDANLTQKDRLGFTIFWVPISTTNYNGPARSQNLWHHDQVNNAFSLIWDHTFSPTLLNQARANAAGWRWNEITTNPQAPFGLPQANIDFIGTQQPQFFGAPGPSNLNQWTYTYSDVLTKVWGRQNIKVGGDYTRLYYLNNPVYAARPGYNFHNLWDFLNDAPYFESGFFNSKTGVPFSNRQDDRENLAGIFVQDDIKLRPNLTINLGLRWSYFGALYSKQDNLDVLEYGSGADLLTGMKIRVGGNLYDPQKTNFGPNIGFAWSPNRFDGKLVLRGGFGIAYNQNEIALTANAYNNPPNGIQANFTCNYPFDTNPTCAGSNIVYQIATDPKSLFGYAPNPNAITSFGPNNLPLGTGGRVTGFDSNPKTIAVYHYSLDMQYELPFNNVMSLGYQGNQTRHAIYHTNLEAVGGAYNLPLNPNVNYVEVWQNAANANYNSLVSSLNHRFSHGFEAQAIYTWSKAMDENSGPYFMDPYPFNVHGAYGRADFNAQNAFKLYGLWQPTLFRGNNLLEKVLGGWSISGIWNIHSGFPFDATYGANELYYPGSGYGTLRPTAVLATYGRDTSNSTFEGQVNPNYGGNPTTYFLSSPYPTANGLAYPATVGAPPLGIHRNSLTGPGYNDVDASLTKAFGLPKMPVLGEGARFEFRADFYNIFNQTNIDPSSIDTSLGAINPDGSVGSVNSHFGVATRALGSRTVQLQARFSF